jgi:uncharacterized membrane protein YedE/YeeE
VVVFTPWSALGGGLLIGLAALLLLACNGRLAGVSGIAGGLWFSASDERAWRALFLAGLILAGSVWWLAGGPVPGPRAHFPPALLVVAGLLVGYGTALAGGCTSGHGVCGLARRSPRSLAATGVFLVVAVLATTFVRHVLHVA